jgi:hypothetical protein
MGQQGKKGGREGWKISRKRQKKEEFYIHAEDMQKGRGMGPERKGKEIGRENYKLLTVFQGIVEGFALTSAKLAQDLFWIAANISHVIFAELS